MELRCIICNRKRVKTKLFFDRDDEEMSLNQCSYCGHWWQSDELYRDIYSTGVFSEKYRGDRTPSFQEINALDSTARERYNFYSKYLRGKNKILEVGSSIGSFINRIRMGGFDANGLEPDPSFASFAKTQYGFDQFNVSIENFSSSIKYDAICSFHVIEHILSPAAFIKKCDDLLLDDGLLIIECPSLELHKYGNLKNTLFKPHIHYFSLSSLFLLISEYFSIIRIRFYESSLYVIATKSRPANTTKLTFLKSRAISKIIYFYNRSFSKLPRTGRLRKYLLGSLIDDSLRYSLGRVLQVLRKKLTNKYYLFSESKDNYNKILHVTHFEPGHNAGDTVLSKCVRDIFNKTGKYGWTLQPIRQRVDRKLIEKINKNKLLLIGGGGLFLPDTNPNDISGWQWAISERYLNEIRVPIIVFAVGYNYFPTQEPKIVFEQNIIALIKRSEFIGLRNRGSIKAVKQIVGEKLGEKLRYQPCPSTIIRKIYPGLASKVKSNIVAINVAFDRYEKRYGNNMLAILTDLAKAIKEIQKRHYKIHVVGHTNWDLDFRYLLEKENINHKIINLTYALPSAIMKYYNQVEMVIGMRGHSQMIPFGLNCKIITIGSHNKMKWFLEDIDFIEAFVDVREGQIKTNLVEKFDYQISNQKMVNEFLLEKQDFLFEETNKNINRIKAMIV